MDFRLERLRAALDVLGNPERGLPAIQVAGTNGKGSTAAMIHSVYSEAGYRCGLFTSPHLQTFRERIRVGTEFIDEGRVVDLVERVKWASSQVDAELTFFEFGTLMALLEFNLADLDMAIFETGLGGRLDATSVVDSVASVISSIGLDHCEWLGDSEEEIAKEKAGIIRAGVPVVTGRMQPGPQVVIGGVARELGSRWLRWGRDFGPRSGSGLEGKAQRHNAGLAAAVIRVLADRFPVDDEKLRLGLENVRWPGRLETVANEPRVVLDVAHNPQSVSLLVEELCELDLPRPLVFVIGVMADKDWGEMACSLFPIADRVVLVPVDSPRGLDPGQLVELADGLLPWKLAETARAGLLSARSAAGREGSVLVTGSIFLVGELYREAAGRDAFDV
ncbi:MAG TPA: bifunctional folylpolyglutamate synthase/dihydrofolate synthase [candidate division UBP10 bacterium]|nr:bifunctional folylpolyglutamate synthase/dihydrofolate synthase [Candidatus Binatota bacterium]